MTFTPLYVCNQCGDIWRIEMIEFYVSPTDTLTLPHCEACGAPVEQKVVEFGGERVSVFGLSEGDE